MKKITLIILLLLPALVNFAQKATLSGYIKDASTGEELIGASIYIEELKTGNVTNVYGFYSLTIPEGTYNITASFLGYQPEKRQIELTTSHMIHFDLSPSSNDIEDVLVEGERKDVNITAVEMSVVKMSAARIAKIPTLMGEADIIKSIQLLPGIQSAGEGSSGFHVRGGGVDQNLILLDDATVYNSSHLFGFFSVFNPDAVKDIQIYKGAIPLKYGGRLSSLLDIRMKEGSQKKFQANGGIGAVSSRLTLEGPIIKDKMAFVVSGRRTYFDLAFPYLPQEALKDAAIYFYDLNAKVNYKINDKNRVYMSAYLGDDIMKFNKDFKTYYGNKTFTTRFNHLFSDKLFSNFTFIYTDFTYGLGVPEGKQAFDWKSNIIDNSFRNDYTWYLGLKHKIEFGGQAIYHSFKPGSIKALGEDSIIQDFEMPGSFAMEYALYTEHEYKITDNISVRYGLRWSAFQNVGKSTFYEFDRSDPKGYLVTDTVKYTGGVINTYSGFEPRANIRWKLNGKSSIKASYARTIQYMHLATNTSAPTPYDFWFPSSPNTKPQSAHQGAIGYFHNLLNNQLETSAEIYYKQMYDVIDFKDHASTMLNPYMEGEIRAGGANAYGLELMIKKQTGKLTGWISYTYSVAKRDIPEINNGEIYPASYDHPNDLSIVVSYEILPRLNASANWIYTTGSPRTMPTGRYMYGNTVLPVYSARNGVRIPDYHRGDISITYDFRKERKNGKPKRFQSSLNFSIYNVYNRHNTYSINFVDDDDNPGQKIAEKTYLFPILPTLTYNFKFL